LVRPAPDSDEPRFPWIADEVHGLARDRQAALHFGTDGDPVNVLTERVREEMVEFVPAVKTDLIAEQAGTDT
jgi:hypothetical protein